MREFVLRLNSAYLENERSIWICEPERVSDASKLVVFLDGERYRDRVGALSVIEELRGHMADSWFVFVSEASPEARWRECPCYPPFAAFVGEELLTWLGSGYIDVNRIQRRVLAGLTYTGLAAAFVAKEYPLSFQRIISQSGSFWWNDCWLAEEFRRLGRKIPVEFWLDVGTPGSSRKRPSSRRCRSGCIADRRRAALQRRITRSGLRGSIQGVQRRPRLRFLE